MDWIRIENLDDVPTYELLWVSDGKRVGLAEKWRYGYGSAARWVEYQEPDGGGGIMYGTKREVFELSSNSVAHLGFAPTHYQRVAQKPLPPC